MLIVLKDKKYNSKPNRLTKDAEEAVLLLKERLCDLVELIIDGLTGKEPDDSLVQGFQKNFLQLSRLLLYNAPAQFHSSLLLGLQSGGLQHLLRCSERILCCTCT